MCFIFSTNSVTEDAFGSTTRRVATGKNFDVNIDRTALRLRIHTGAATVSNESTFVAHGGRHNSKSAPEPHASYHSTDAKSTVVGKGGESLHGVAQVLEVQTVSSGSQRDTLSQSEVVLHKGRHLVNTVQLVKSLEHTAASS